MYRNKNSDPPEIAGEFPDFPMYQSNYFRIPVLVFHSDVIRIKLFGTFDKCTGSTLAGTGSRSQNTCV